MMPSPHGSGSGPRRSATLPINLEPRQRATPPAPPSEMTHCLRGQANEMTSSPRSDRGTAEAAGVLPQASYHSFVENLDHRGRQYPHGNSRGHTMGARIDVHLQAHIAVFVPPGHNPHRGMPPISLNLATDPRTLALEPQTALSIGERTPIVESPRSYHDGTDVRSPATESTASDLSELGWPFRPS